MMSHSRLVCAGLAFAVVLGCGKLAKQKATPPAKNATRDIEYLSGESARVKELLGYDEVAVFNFNGGHLDCWLEIETSDGGGYPRQPLSTYTEPKQAEAASGSRGDTPSPTPVNKEDVHGTIVFWSETGSKEFNLRLNFKPSATGGSGSGSRGFSLGLSPIKTKAAASSESADKKPGQFSRSSAGGTVPLTQRSAQPDVEYVLWSQSWLESELEASPGSEPHLESVASRTVTVSVKAKLRK